MKIVIIGATGLIGTKLAGKLREKGHEVVPAAPSTGVNTITGEGPRKRPFRVRKLSSMSRIRPPSRTARL